MNDQFDEIWKRIVEHAGEQFQTRAGRTFRYVIEEGDRVRPTQTDFSVSRAEIRQYFLDIAEASTGKIAAVSGGPSFVWAILTDVRIMRH